MLDDEDRFVSYAGVAGQTVFDVPFAVFDVADLHVEDGASGTAIDGGFSYDAAASTVTLTTPLAADTTVEVTSRISGRRGTEFAPNSALRSDDLNAEFDQVYAGIKDLRRDVAGNTDGFADFQEAQSLRQSDFETEINSEIAQFRKDFVSDEGTVNLLNPDRVEYSYRYSTGGDNMVASSDTLVSSGPIKLQWDTWYTLSGAGYFGTSSAQVGLFTTDVFAIGLSSIGEPSQMEAVTGGVKFKTPVGSGSLYGAVNLDKVAGQNLIDGLVQLEIGEAVSAYEIFNPLGTLEPALLPEGVNNAPAKIKALEDQSETFVAEPDLYETQSGSKNLQPRRPQAEGLRHSVGANIAAAPGSTYIGAEMVQVEPNTDYVFHKPWSSAPQGGYYDTDQIVAGTAGLGAITFNALGNDSFHFKTPSVAGDLWILVTVFRDGSLLAVRDDIQLEKGTSFTGYVEHVAPREIIREDRLPASLLDREVSPVQLRVSDEFGMINLGGNTVPALDIIGNPLMSNSAYVEYTDALGNLTITGFNTEPPSDIEAVMGDGQSLRIGAAAGSIINALPISPKVITFVSGMKCKEGDDFSSLRLAYEDDESPDGGAGRGETGMMEFGKAWISRGETNRLFLFNIGFGGRSWTFFDDDTGTVDEHFDEVFVPALEGLKSIADKQGVKAKLRAIIRHQGEANTGATATPANYFTGVRNLITQYQNRAKLELDQTEDIPVIHYQTSFATLEGWTAAAGAASGQTTNRGSTLGQLQLADSEPDIFMSCPVYWLQHAADGTHLTAESYIKLDQVNNYIFERIRAGDMTKSHISPTGAVASGSTVTISFQNWHTGPLVLDGSSIPMTEDFGFYVEDTTGEVDISSVAVVGDDIVITTAAPITGAGRVTYALHRQAEFTITGPGQATGNLRDSTSEVPRWAPHFEVAFT